jgi:hypothetical protein
MTHAIQKTIKVTVTKEGTGYSAKCSIGKTFIGTQGDTFQELKENILEAISLATDKETKFEDLKLEYDLNSFFHFYKVINAKALSERIGMNQSLLAQYIKGSKKPTFKQIARIVTGIKEIGRELTEVDFLPVK